VNCDDDHVRLDKVLAWFGSGSAGRKEFNFRNGWKLQLHCFEFSTVSSS